MASSTKNTVILYCFLYSVWNRVTTQLEVPFKKPQIYYLHIASDIKYRYATTMVVSKVLNINLKSEEVLFDITLPKEAFINNFTMETSDKTYVGEVKEKEKAKQEFERAKSRGQSAGHIAAAPRETNKFNIRINVEAESIAIFRLTYQELLKRTTGSYHHVIFVDPGEPIEDFNIQVDIQESRDITQLKVQPMSHDSIFDGSDAESLATIDRTSLKSVKISYSPTLDQQKKISTRGLSGQFQVSYDVKRDKDAGDVLIVNGYFIHFFAPNNIEPLPKDILIILDKSGSMNGQKIKQQADAILHILDDVTEIDRFNVLFFDDRLTWFKSNAMIGGSPRNIEDAKAFVKMTYANGGTNINGALSEGLKLLMRLYDGSRSPLVMFLTDGQPTAGVTSIKTIMSNVDYNNEMDIPIFSLAFGNGADYDFLKKLSAQNNGFARKIYEDSNADLQIEGLYAEISTALLRNVSFSYLDNEVEENSVTQTDFPTYFSGSELVVAGKLKTTAVKEMELAVYGQSSKGRIELETPSEMVQLNLTSEADFATITEKMWAFLTIKQLINELEKDITDDIRTEIKQKILEMSLKYQFVTPLTSMVVTKPLLEDIPSPLSTEDSSVPLPNSHAMVNKHRVPPLHVHGRGGTHMTRTAAMGMTMPNTAMASTSATRVFLTSATSTLMALSTRMTTSTIAAPSTRMTTATIAPPNVCKQYRGYRSTDVFVYLKGLDTPLCMKLPFHPDPLQQDDYLFLKEQGNELTANIRQCIFGQPDDHVMLIEAVNFRYNVRFNIDGGRLLNGSTFSWASVGKRYNVTFGSLQTTVEIAPSKGPIGPLEVHAYISHKLNSSISTDGILSHFIGMRVKSAKITRKRKSQFAKIQIKKQKKKFTIKKAILLKRISSVATECWQVKDPEKQFKMDVENFSN